MLRAIVHYLPALVLLFSACGDDKLKGIPYEEPPLICEDGQQPVNGECPVVIIEQPLGAITGQLCDATIGVWREGVTASVSVGEDIIGDVTDAQGRFLLDNIPAGSYYVDFEGPQGYTNVLPTTVQSGEITTVGDTECIPPPGNMSGRVCDSVYGTWVQGAVITLDDPENSSTTSDEIGRFMFFELPPGEYTITITHENGFEEIRHATVLPGETTDTGVNECIGEAGSIAGRVCDDLMGVWVEGATITLNDAEGTSTVTDADGVYIIHDIDAGSYIITISYEDTTYTIPVIVNNAQTTELGPLQCVGRNGGVVGRICGADGYWLSGASVSIELPDGTTFETMTDGQGNFALGGIAPGTYTVDVVKGSFSTQFEVTILPGEVNYLPEPVCIPPTTSMAVVTGIYDNVENILVNLGYTIRASYTAITPNILNDEGTVDLIKGDDSFWMSSFLADPVWMQDYDIIFFNCGLTDTAIKGGDSSVGPAIENLKNYVSGGKSVYASDWASEIIRLTFHERINFYGNDSTHGDARVGTSNNSQLADVTDSGLEANLGSNSVTINLNLPAWVVMQANTSQPQDLRVLIRGNIRYKTPTMWWPATLNNSPLVVSFQHGNGRVLFTSAHNEGQITQDLQNILNYIVFEL